MCLSEEYNNIFFLYLPELWSFLLNLILILYCYRSQTFDISGDWTQCSSNDNDQCARDSVTRWPIGNLQKLQP